MGMVAEFGGLVVVEIVSADMESTFDAIMEKGISVYSVSKTDELTASFEINRGELTTLLALANRRGESVNVVEKDGIFWYGKRLLSRPVLIFGAVFLMLLTVFLPGRIFFVEVEGNSAVPPERIIESARECGLSFFADRKQLRNEIVKNKIINDIPEIEWVGVNTRGCVAYIGVRERSGILANTDNTPCSIVAGRDGVISSISVSYGTRKCEVGDAVSKDQLLISGYTDCGNVLLSGRAEGEVFAFTSRELIAISPGWHFIKNPTTESVTRYSIRIGKKRINLWKGSGISPLTCDRMYEEYWITLPGGFTLPVCLIRERFIPYEQELETANESAETAASAMEGYLLKHIPGGRILNQNIEQIAADDVSLVKGIYGCIEMIGRQKSDKIGEDYG